MTGRREKFRLHFQTGTIKHLGLQMYSTLPPVLGELVANAWDADSPQITIAMPETKFDDSSEIVVRDWGHGMTEDQVQSRYLKIGRDRRDEEETDVTPGRTARNGEAAIPPRPVMGRKGIGKFSPFGIAKEIEIETIRDGQTSRFIMDYDRIMAAKDGVVEFANLPATGEVTEGTRVVLRRLQRYRKQAPSIPQLRRGLARRFSVITNGLEVIVNEEAITVTDRDLRMSLAKDSEDKPYLWEYSDVEVQEGTGWKVSGWIGALNRTDDSGDGIQRGVAIMARGKLVQDPWVFEATVGQQYALSYLVGELTAEFVDAEEDTIATSRNTLVWDTEANRALKKWGQKQVNLVAREWAERRKRDNEHALEQNPRYQEFLRESAGVDNTRARRAADSLIRANLASNPLGDDRTNDAIIRLCIDYLKFDAFVDLASDLASANVADPAAVAKLFREWEIVEAREMMRVTEGRIETIERLQELIESDALEVPVLHNFLRDFPWVLDPRWNLIADEERYSSILRSHFPDEELEERDRRIDFLCVREGMQLVVVEIKRPSVVASTKELTQIEDYVHFMRDLTERKSDPDVAAADVVGYLLVGNVADKGTVRQKVASLAQARIYVRTYNDLLEMVKRSHRDFLKRYSELRAAGVSSSE
jgi:Histidine kinase-, DNA gyrase B-, and HSP90-like ATPase